MKGLLFDSPRALAVALGSKVVPADVAASPVRFGYVDPEDPGGPLLVDVAGVPSGVVKALVEFGVKRASVEVVAREAPLWPAIVAPLRGPLVDELVLFAASTAELGLSLATDLLVQGCERIELASFASGVLVRASRPSHYVVLKALEVGRGCSAYAPVQPGNDSTYVELGFTHPTMAGVTVAPPNILLVRGTGAVERIATTTFQPVWDYLDLGLTAGPPAGPVLSLPKRRVTLRLARAVTPKPATLWVIRERAIEVLDQLVGSSPEELLRALSFSAWDDPSRGEPTVALRSVEPLSLQLDAEAYAPHAELADVFIPVDRRVHPPVWADRLRAAVGGPDDRVRWLVDVAGQGVRVESVALDSLAPLVDWVELVADARHVDAWKRGVTFEPEAFDVLFGDVVPDHSQSERDPQAKERPKRAPKTTADPTPPATLPAAQPSPTSRARGRAARQAAATVTAESEAEVDLRAMEAGFRSSEAPLASPERASTWLDLARLYDATKQPRDAGMCRARLVFEGGEASDLALEDWLASSSLEPDRLAEIVERTVANPAPSSAEMYQLVAALRALARRPADGALAAPLFVRAFETLVDQGSLLCVRALWIGMRSLVSLSGEDALALARARDHLFGRLESGLSLSRDVPRVVRSFDADLGDRRQALADVLRFFETTTRVRSPVEAAPATTLAYVRLVIAIAMARTGDSERALTLQRDATRVVLGDARGESADPVHALLVRWFGARILQALEGDPESAPLPRAALLERDKLDRLQQYKVDRVRQSVKLVEPDTDLDPFKSFGAGGTDPRTVVLRRLHAATHKGELEGILDEARSTAAVGTTEERVDKLLALLAAMGECPVRLVTPRLTQFEDLLRELSPDAVIKVALQALPLTERFETPETSVRLVRIVCAHLASVDAAKIGDVAGRLARGGGALRRHAEAATLQGPLLQLTERLTSPDPASAIGRLSLARALATLGNEEGAAKTLAEERGLLQKQLAPAQRLGLIRALASTAAAIRATDVIVGLTVEWAKTTDSYNTNSHLCLSAVELCDAIASALVPHRGDAVSIARRLADEDEWAIRSHVLSEEDSP
jgi:cellulose synthase operon protein C